MDPRTTIMADLAKRICARVADCKDEAKTKAYAIVPAFRAWGWDEADPQQVVHEAPFRLPGDPSPTWCDYAFMVDGQQAVLIEAKAHGKDLDREYSQLHDYFGRSRSVLAILTDGQTWRFYSDLDFPNQMDHEPFRVIDMCDLREGDEEFLRAFRREGFEAVAIRTRAAGARESERLRERLRRWLDKALANPSDALVRLAMTESDYDGRRGQAEIESWRAGIRSASADVKGATLAIDKERAVAGSEYHSPRDLATPLTAPGKPDSGMPTRRPSTKPDGFRLWGKYYPARNWNDVWYGVAEALYNRHPDRFRDVVGKPRGKRSYVELDRQMLSSPVYRVRDSQYWVGGHGSREALEGRCRNLLELLGYAKSDIEFLPPAE